MKQAAVRSSFWKLCEQLLVIVKEWKRLPIPADKRSPQARGNVAFLTGMSDGATYRDRGGARSIRRGRRPRGQLTRPHALIDVIAVVGHGLNDDDKRATACARSARAPDLSRAEFFRVFPFRDRVTHATIAEILERFGF